VSEVSNDRFAGVTIMDRKPLMAAFRRGCCVLAMGGLGLSAPTRTASAQGFQSLPVPASSAIITRDLPGPAAATQKPKAGMEKPLPLADKSVAAANKPTPANGASAGRPTDLAGRYIILREGGRDVGCMLTLDDKAHGPGGDLKAQLAPACRDQGIVVFDPVAWRVERGRLVLTARKGHTATFDWQADGAWWKDPSEGGKPLGVRKI